MASGLTLATARREDTNRSGEPMTLALNIAGLAILAALVCLAVRSERGDR